MGSVRLSGLDGFPATLTAFKSIFASVQPVPALLLDWTMALKAVLLENRSDLYSEIDGASHRGEKNEQGEHSHVFKVALWEI
jgi:hypothetical protein